MPARIAALILLLLTAASFAAPVDDPETQAAAALARIEGLDNESAEMDAGALVLTGVADDPAIIDEAEQAVRDATGIQDIQNDIALTSDYADRVRGAATRVSARYDRLLDALPLIPVAIAIVLLALLAAWIIARWNWPFRLFSRNPFLQTIAQRFVQSMVVLFGVLLALEILDATALVGGVLGAAGVAGIAIGFAFRDLIENYIASILLSLRQPFRPRDHVVIDGHEGLVTSMNSRTTVLTTFDGNVVRIPNAIVFKTTLINYSTDPRRRFDFTVGIGYDVDLAQAVTVGTQILAETEGVMPDPKPLALITKLGDSSITLQLFAWVDQSAHDFSKVRSAAMQRIKSEFDRLDIDMPEPIYTVKLQQPQDRPAPAPKR
ncbi:MAG: mechanosensitive ion channel family protein, partial [Planctomycetota bacterium]